MEFIKLRDETNFIQDAAVWFSQKWDISKEAYIESMHQMMEGIGVIPQWYLVVNNTKIIAGVGVIENDFHERKDLKPNLCALYVEEEYRSQGIARDLLNFVYEDMLSLDIDILYLITDHVNLYEKLNWNFFTEVRDDDNMLTRMYKYKTKKRTIDYFYLKSFVKTLTITLSLVKIKLSIIEGEFIYNEC